MTPQINDKTGTTPSLNNQNDHWFSGRLLRWYAQYGRELPWRGTTDAYTIWISEVILQQTRVDQGYAYFQRFIQRFPDVLSLANADEDEVMKFWQGLGYYSRARNLHAAAKSMADGVFPTTYDGVRALKGVGEYTAAAICSIAYGFPYPVVDGNVYRVIARYLGIDTPVDSTQGKKEIAQWAHFLMDASSPSAYNQAIMDFGALQCTPKSPNCHICPLVERCLAFAGNCVSDLPVKQRKQKTTNRYFNYFYLHTKEYTYIYKRAGNDIWKNLFEFPLIETDTDFSHEELMASAALEQLIPSGSPSTLKLLARDVKHILSHRVIYANLYEVVLEEDARPLLDYQRVAIDELDRFPVSRLMHILLEKCL